MPLSPFLEFDMLTIVRKQTAIEAGLPFVYSDNPADAELLSKGYVREAVNDTKEVFPRAMFPGERRKEAAAFSIGSKGYMGTGIPSGGLLKDFWEYDPATDVWTQMADFGGTARGNAVGFSIGAKGYMGIGSNGGNNKDFWEYDPATDIWTQMADCVNFTDCLGFSFGGDGYVGLGTNPLSGITNLLYKYDVVSDTWTLVDIPLELSRAFGVAFVIGGVAYVGLGSDFTGQFSSDLWQFGYPKLYRYIK